MIDVSKEILTIVMLGGILVGILTGFPLGYVIGTLGLVGGYLVFGNAITDLYYSRIVDFLFNYILLAVPLFIFMGTMLEHSGIAEKMYDALYLWLGGLRGGLAVTTVLIGTILAATVGIIAASVTMLSLVALPSMIKRGYSKSFASGSVCAGGCLGILIPPSIMLVIYGPMAQISVGKLFFAAFIPGIILSGLYCTYIIVHSFLQPQVAPSVPPEDRVGVSLVGKTVKLVTAVAPTGLLVMAVLGVIFLGIAPPTEAAATGALMATLLTITYRRFSLQVLREVCLVTIRTCGFIFLIAAMAFAFTATFIGGGGGEVMANIVMSTPGGRWGAFVAIMFIVFILGFFIDWIGIVFVMVPIISPIAAALEFDPLWFAMMVIVNLQMSFMTPPMAMAIFIIRGAAPPELGVTTADIIRGVIPFVILVMVALGLFIIFPELIIWLPGKMIKSLG